MDGFPRMHILSDSCSDARAPMAEQRDLLGLDDPTIEGFNIGMNCGEVAGQTVFHCHVHLIPRRRGDVENPRGGVRHVIAGKGHYKESK
jgi:ATP adenylyltransferase